MPRTAREMSPTDYYHVMMRGIDKEKIFPNSILKKFIQELIQTHLKENQITIIAYCIMDNHLHLVVKGDLNKISIVLKKINIRFAMKFNKEQDRVGHVFQDRFRSEIIHNDQQLLQVIRYVHNNPVKAKIVSLPKDYKWSSISCYTSKEQGIVDQNSIEEILKLAGGLESFLKFHETADFTEFLDTKEELENNRLEHAQTIIESYCKNNGIEEINQKEIYTEHLLEIAKSLMDETKLSHRKIAGILQINNNIVHSLSKVSKQV